MLVQAAGLILLPLYTRYLSRDDFGLLEILTRIGETVSTVLVIGGLRQATLSFYQQAENQNERLQIVTAAIGSMGLCCLLGCMLTLGMLDWVPWILQIPANDQLPGLLRLAILTIAIEPFILIPLALMQARTESVQYALSNLVLFLLRVGLCVILVAVFGLGIQGVLLGTAISVGMFGLALVIRELRKGMVLPSWSQVVELWRFALPFLPGGLCFFLLHHGDRFWLSSWWGMAEVGVYALAYKLAMALNTFALAPLQLVWSPQVYRLARESDAPIRFGVVFTRILAVYAFCGLMLSAGRREIVQLLSPPSYAAAATLVVPIVLACFCQAGATLMDSAFYIRRRTDLKLLVTAITALVILGLYSCLIPPLGAMGAALATLIGFAFLLGLTWQVTQRIFPVRYEGKRLMGLISLALVTGFILEQFPAGWSWLLLKWAICGAFPVILWHAGLISRVEKGYAADLVQNLWRGIHRLQPRQSRRTVPGNAAVWRSSG